MSRVESIHTIIHILLMEWGGNFRDFGGRKSFPPATVCFINECVWVCVFFFFAVLSPTSLSSGVPTLHPVRDEHEAEDDGLLVDLFACWPAELVSFRSCLFVCPSCSLVQTGLQVPISGLRFLSSRFNFLHPVLVRLRETFAFYLFSHSPPESLHASDLLV